jgi:hypothetical protein
MKTSASASLPVVRELYDQIQQVKRQMANEKCNQCGRGGTSSVSLKEATCLVVRKGLEALRKEGLFKEE